MVVHKNVRAFRGPDLWKGSNKPNKELLFNTMTEVQCIVVVAGSAQPEAVDIRLHRPSVSRGVLLSADKAIEFIPGGNTLG